MIYFLNIRIVIFVQESTVNLCSHYQGCKLETRVYSEPM